MLAEHEACAVPAELYSPSPPACLWLLSAAASVKMNTDLNGPRGIAVTKIGASALNKAVQNRQGRLASLLAGAEFTNLAQSVPSGAATSASHIYASEP